MKKIIYQLLGLCTFLVAFTACEDMDSTYEEFVVPGGITYAGKPTHAVAYAGQNRVKLEWDRGADPAVTKARVYWNNFKDSVEVPIPATGNKISVIIDNLPERSYSFVVRTFDEKGNKSVPVELITGSYGQNYQETILSRPLNGISLSGNGNNLILSWGAAYISGGAYRTEVKYTNKAGNVVIQRDSVTTPTTEIPNDVVGSIEYRTLFLPSARTIDTFYTESAQRNAQRLTYSKIGWTVDSFSSQHPGAANAAANLIDGNPVTRWHTLASGTPRYPHHIVIDTKTEKTITAFDLSRPLNSVPVELRGPDTFRIEVSNDKVTWQNMGTFNFNRTIDGGQYYTLPTGTTARYFKLTGLTSNQAHMVLGELNLYGN